MTGRTICRVYILNLLLTRHDKSRSYIDIGSPPSMSTYQTIPTATKRESGLRTDDAANAGGREDADDIDDVDN